MSDTELSALLHHPTVVGYTDLRLQQLHRDGAELVPVDSEQSQVVERQSRTKRKRGDPAATSKRRQKRPFSWADIRLPAATQLEFFRNGHPRYIGGAAFLSAHPALTSLDTFTMLLSTSEYVAILQHSAVLPNLTRLAFQAAYQHPEPVSAMTALTTALGTAVVGRQGRPRPITYLSLWLCDMSVFAAASRLSELTELVIALEEWADARDVTAALPHLQQLRVCRADRLTHGTHHAASRAALAAVDMLPFLQAFARSPLQVLDFGTRESVDFSAAAVAQLAQFDQLRELSINVETTYPIGSSGFMDWSDAALFASFSAGCLPGLRSVTLYEIKLFCRDSSCPGLCRPPAAAHRLARGADVPPCHPLRPARSCVERGAGVRHHWCIPCGCGGCRAWQHVQAVHACALVLYRDVLVHVAISMECAAIAAELGGASTLRVHREEQRPTRHLCSDLPTGRHQTVSQVSVAAIVRGVYRRADRPPSLCRLPWTDVRAPQH